MIKVHTPHTHHGDPTRRLTNLHHQYSNYF